MLGLCALLLAACTLGSLWLGSKDLAPADVWRALTRPDDSYAALVLASRVPRTLLAFLTGSALAVAGALIRR